MRAIKRLTATVVFAVVSISVSAQEKAGKKDTAKHTVIYSSAPQAGFKQQLSKKEQMKLHVTKKTKHPVHAAALNNNHRKCSNCGMNRTMSAKEKMKVNVVNNYRCPLQFVTADKKETCNKCDKTFNETEADE